MKHINNFSEFRVIMILAAVSLFLSGCSSLPKKLNELNVGMSKIEVKAIVGSPDTKGSNGSAELWYFNRVVVGFGDERNFFVKFIDDKVASYGQVPFQPIAGAMMPMQFQPYQPYQQTTYQMPINRPVNVNCTSNRVGQYTYTNCQ